jgi:hypothetical protein
MQRSAFRSLSQQLLEGSPNNESISILDATIESFCCPPSSVSGSGSDAGRDSDAGASAQSPEQPPEHVSAALRALQVDDEGFGDPDFEYMGQLKEALLELMFLTHVNVSATTCYHDEFVWIMCMYACVCMQLLGVQTPSNGSNKWWGSSHLLFVLLFIKLQQVASTDAINNLISTLVDNRPHVSFVDSQDPHRCHRGGLDMFDSFYNTTSDSVGYPQELLVLEPLLLHSNVHMNATLVEPAAMTLATMLACICTPRSDQDRHRSCEGTLSGLFLVTEAKQQQQQGHNGPKVPLFDAGAELVQCPGGLDTKAGELFCSVDAKVTSSFALFMFHISCFMFHHHA